MSSHKDCTSEVVGVHKCEGCGMQFKASALNLARKTVRQKLCVRCTRIRLHNEAAISAFAAKVWKKFKTDITVISYVDNNSVATFECSCGKRYKATPTSLIRKSKKAGISCGKCSSETSVRPAIKVGKRRLHATPVEEQAIRFLIAHKGFTESKFGDTSECDPLVVKAGKRTLLTLPSFRYKKAYVSVFDAATFARDWSVNAAIVKKCRSKYDAHKTVVVCADKAIVLSAEWFKDKTATLKSINGATEVTSVTVLSLDPGTANHGWAVLRITKPFKVEVIAHGLVSNTITEMRGNMAVQGKAYTAELQSIIEQYGCNRLAAERYMTRGIKGTTIECVNAMIGCLLALSWPACGDVVEDKMLLPASQWKNEWNRYSSLDEFYKRVKCVPHQVDAVGIGLYAGAIYLGAKPFEGIAKLEKTLAPAINKSNTELPKKR